jgi:hypothetical protein
MDSSALALYGGEQFRRTGRSRAYEACMTYRRDQVVVRCLTRALKLYKDKQRKLITLAMDSNSIAITSLQN